MFDLFEIVAVFGSAWPFFQDHWWSGWTWLTLVCLFHFNNTIENNLSGIPRAALFWTLLRGAEVFLNRTKFSEFGGETAMALDNCALGATFTVFLILVILLAIKRESLERLEELFAASCVANSVFVLYQVFRGDVPGGFLGNPSMNGTFIALTFPLLNIKSEVNQYDHLSLGDALEKHSLRMHWDAFCVFIPILAIFCTGQSVPVGTFAVIVVASIFLMDHPSLTRERLGAKISVALGFLGSVVVVALWKIPDFFHSSGRFQIWKADLDWLFKNGYWFSGTGLGTYFMFGPHVQTEYHIGEGNWFWVAHNDWLQVFFELGLVGFLLYLLLFCATLIRFYKPTRAYLTISLIGYGASAVFNFPSHLAPTALLGAVLVMRLRDGRST
jgi:O-antigen ligase